MKSALPRALARPHILNIALCVAMTSTTSLGLAQTAPSNPPPVLAPAPAATPPAPATSDAKTPPADDSTTGHLEDIVITATRRSEQQSKVPMSVSAFTQEDLDMKGVKDFNDVARFTPGVSIDSNGSNNISIRGISSSAGSGTTGVYIDDTPIQMRALGFNADDTLPQAFDLDRIEVLRGPQGTLFGAGAEGGAVRYIMAQPNMEQASTYARSELSFTQGGAPSYEAGVAYGAPIIQDELGFRASLWFRHSGGWIDRVNGATGAVDQSDANFANEMALRAAVKWNVNDNLTVTPSILYQNRNVNDVTAYWPILSDPNSNRYRNGDPGRQPEPDHYVLPALKIEADLNGLNFYSNTSYYYRHDLSGYNGTEYNLGYYQTFNDASNSPYLPMLNPNYYPLIDGNGIHLPPGAENYMAQTIVTNEQQTIAQEFRLESSDPKARLVWTGGLFFSINKQTSIEEINDPMLNSLFQTLFGVSPSDPSAFGLPLLPNGDSYYNYNYSRDTQAAIFGEATYAVTDKLKLTAGLRYADTNVNFTHFADGPQNFGTSQGIGSENNKPFTPKFSIAYQADPNDLFYTTYAKGFRIGGANAPIPVAACAADLANLGLSAAPDDYAADTTLSWEIGSKNKLTDNLRMATSIYYTRWQGIQQDIYLPGCGFQFTSNFGDAVAKGGDLQLEYAVTRALSLELALGYTDAKYSTSAGTAANLIAAPGDAIQGASGNPAPPRTVAVGIQYDFSALEHKSFVRLDWEYAARSNVHGASEDPVTASYDPLAYTPSSSSFFSVRTGTTVGKWTFSAFVDNLFDSHPTYPPSSSPHSDQDPYNPYPPSQLIRAYTLRPRTIGIGASCRY